MMDASSLLKVVCVVLVAGPCFANETQERKALTRLYYENGGETWASASNWLQSNVSICDWQFISCAGAKVVSIKMPGNGVSGPLLNPPFWKGLVRLENVDFSNNRVSGNVSEALSTLPPSILVVDLQGNLLAGDLTMSGSTPCSSKRVPNTFLTLYFQDNSLTSAFPDSMPSCLGKLDLSRNRISDIPSLVSPGLDYLYLTQNALNPADPSWMDDVCDSRLRALHVDQNPQLRGTLPGCIGDSSLEDLVIRNTSMSGTIPMGVGNIVSLKQLILSQSRFSGVIPDVFDGMDSLQTVVIGEGLGGTFPQSIFSISRDTISFQGNRLSGTLPPVPSGVAVGQLLLSENKLEGTIPSSVWLRVARQIVLDNNNFQGTIPSPQLRQRKSDAGLEIVTFFNNPGLAGRALGFYADYANIPWLNTSTSIDSFFAGLDMLAPVPIWEVQMGAGEGKTLTLDSVTPALLPNHRGATIALRGGLLYVPLSGDAQPFRVAFCMSPTNCSHTDPTTWVATLPPVVPTVVSDELFYAELPADFLVDRVGTLYIALLYVDSDGSMCVSTVSDSTLLYEQSPTILRAAKESGSNELHATGCETIVVEGTDFANTSQNLCRLTPGGGAQGGNGSEGLDPVVFPAVYHNQSHMTCVVPHPLPFSSNTTVMSSFAVSPNNGATWGSNTGSVFRFVPWCSLQDLPPGHAPCEAGCGLCACSAVGTCVAAPDSPSQPYCACPAGFAGANCSECAPGFFGPECTACSDCNHGVCSDGKLGDGTCDCDDAFTGATCHKLQPTIIALISVGGVLVLCMVACICSRVRCRASAHRAPIYIVETQANKPSYPIQYSTFAAIGD